MKRRRVNQNTANPKALVSIKTTFLELIEVLAALTKNDRHLLAAVKHIFTLYDVKSARTLAPVKLVATVKPVQSKANRRPSWA